MLHKIFPRLNITSIKLIILTAIFWTVFANFSFFAALLKDYPFNLDNIGFLAALTVGFTSVIIIVLALFCQRYTTKPLLIILLIASSFVAYFMDSYNVLIDTSMIQNALSTDVKEASDLLSPTMFIYVLLLGILPSIFVYRAKIQFQPFRKELMTRLKLLGAISALVLVLYLTFGANVSSFFREHKVIRYYYNPANYVFALGKHISRTLKSDANKPITILGEDAKISGGEGHRELIIMVVGETARADRFSLNGYARKTNPLLEQQDVISFSNFRSCATSTAISVPCMFSIDHEDHFDSSKAKHKENALDVLKHAGVQVLWRDNNSSSKHVADRVLFQDYRTAEVNTICDEECRDVGMLVGLQEYIDGHAEGDILIILHQMGNHGPAYYKRYPKEFEKFTPTCKTNELSDCSEEEIDNAYDNAILYTDYFLNQTIELLKGNDEKFETALLYVSDHGESLGEYGMYLHGMPNIIAPETQRHVPAIVWIGSNFDEIDVEALKAKRDNNYTHDNIFHALLGFMEIDSSVYDVNMDFIKN